MKAIITGITGQDGSHLADLLLEKGYEVHGTVRRTSTQNRGRIRHIKDRIHLHYADLGDSSSLCRLLADIKPDEIYNLGAQSHVRVSFDIPEYTGDITAVGVTRLLEAYRMECPEARFYQASSSEMFGGVGHNMPLAGYNETSAFYPRSPYGAAKVYGFWMAKNYRESYGLNISNGILFNHEGERRGETFVTRKITRGLTRIVMGLQEDLVLGNLDASRDWGYAKDYMKAAWMMLQQPKGDDFVIATGEAYTVRQFLNICAGILGLDVERIVKFDAKFTRPAEVDFLLGDPSHAKKTLGWAPDTDLTQLAKIMLDHDMKLAEREWKLA